MDLTTVRRRLDLLNDQIVIRLKERTRFARNAAVYEPGAIRIAGHHGQSLLDFALAGLEIYHASLGRYVYPDQHPIHSGVPTDTPLERVVSAAEVLPPIDLSMADMFRFYESLVPQLAPDGDAPETYGECAYVDADIVIRLHERINMGRYVAHTKVTRDPSLRALMANPEALRASLVDPQREQEVITGARRLGERYDLNPDIVARVFRWIIEETLNVEVRYLLLHVR